MRFFINTVGVAVLTIYTQNSVVITMYDRYKVIFIITGYLAKYRRQRGNGVL